MYNSLFEQNAPQRSVAPAAPWIMVTQASDVPASFPGSPIHPASPPSLILDDIDSEMHEPGVILPGRAPRPLGEGTESSRSREAAPAAPQGTSHMPREQGPGETKLEYKKNLECKFGHKLEALRESEEVAFNTTMTTLTSIDLPKGSMRCRTTSGPLPSDKLPGVPTASGPLDPGAYHSANAMLRRQLPHYHVR